MCEERFFGVGVVLRTGGRLLGGNAQKKTPLNYFTEQIFFREPEKSPFFSHSPPPPPNRVEREGGFYFFQGCTALGGEMRDNAFTRPESHHGNGFENTEGNWFFVCGSPCGI